MSNTNEVDKHAVRTVTHETTNEGDGFTKGDNAPDNQLVSADGSSLYLIPTPAFDTEDPLNWSQTRKWTVLAILLLWSSAALSIQSFLLNYIPSVSARFPDASPSQVNLLCTIIMVMIAPGQLIFTSLAIRYGRRFSLLLANALLLASSLWAAFATSYNSLLGARIVEGLAAGPTDCMIYVMVQEFTFLHERGTVMGALMAGQLALQLCIGIGTNYMAVTTSFDAPFYLFAGISAFTLIAMFFFMPETRYDRSNNTALPRVKENEYAAFKEAMRGDNHQTWGHVLTKRLKFWAPPKKGLKDHSILHFCQRMGVYCVSPLMWWNAGINLIMCGSLLAASTYYATMLVSPPWSWAPQNVGLINIGPALMAPVNWLLLGWGNDKVMIWLAKRNGGVSRPEHRLVVLIIPIVTGVVATIGFGFLGQNYLVTNPGGTQPHWFSVVFIYSLYFQSFGGIIEATLIYLANTTHAEDSLAVMTLVAVIRDTASFGMGYGIVSFSDSVGFATSFGIYALLTGLIGLAGIPLYFYGDWIRARLHVSV